MEKDKLIEAVWELIDNESSDLSKREYLDFLEQISTDADIRAEAMRGEITDDDE